MREVKPTRTNINTQLDKMGRGDLAHLMSYAASVGPERAITEYSARLCYNSVAKLGTAPNFVTNVLSSGHLSVAEHASVAMPIDKLITPVTDLKTTRGTPQSVKKNARVQEVNRLVRYNRFFTQFPGFIAGNLRSWFEVLGEMRYNPLMEVFISIIPEAFNTTPIFSEIELSHIADTQPVNVPGYFGAGSKHNCVLLAVNPGSFDRIIDRTPKPNGWHPWARYTFLVENVSRTLTHQLVRHRGGSFSQESQRYVDSRKGNFIVPPGLNDTQRQRFLESCYTAVETYEVLRDSGVRKEDARFVLPGASATRLIVSFDLKELVHFLNVRCEKDAQWEIRRLARTMAYQAMLALPFPQLEKVVEEYKIYGFDDSEG